ATDPKNYAYGSWAQYSGNGEWAESDNHVQPRSLFYAQLHERLNKDVSVQAAILPRNTNASSSPTVEVAQQMTKEAKLPRLTLEYWINQQPFNASVKSEGLFSSNNLKSKPMKMTAYKPTLGIENGRLVCDGALITGS
ncbi:pectate lyase, partial [bacterium]|nr:pectate lyase [bacterium]